MKRERKTYQFFRKVQMLLKRRNRRFATLFGLMLCLIIQSTIIISCTQTTQATTHKNRTVSLENNKIDSIIRKTDITKTTDNNTKKDALPAFPGGDEKLIRFIKENLKYPPTDNCIMGRVILCLHINKEGCIDSIEVVRRLDPAFDEEAIRVIKLLPKWIPAKRNGINVDSTFTLPIVFRIK